MGYEKDKKSALKKFKELCKKSPTTAKLQDIPIPKQYEWIWKHFLNIWYQCEYDMVGNIIFTYATVNEYVECMKVPLTVLDKKCLFKMKGWALETISEVREKE